MARLRLRTLRHALPRRLRHARWCPRPDCRRLARDRRRHRGNHLGGEGFAAASLGVPRRGWCCRGRACDGAQSPAAENQPMIKTSAASLAALFGRIPKIALFGVAALLQVVLLAVMIIDRAQILREGTEVTLQTRPVDPRDLLRGDYVVLGYDMSQLPAGPLLNQPAASRNPMLFVKLAQIGRASRRERG